MRAVTLPSLRTDLMRHTGSHRAWHHMDYHHNVDIETSSVLLSGVDGVLNRMDDRTQQVECNRSEGQYLTQRHEKEPMELAVQVQF